MNKKIQSALISVYYKDGLDAIIKRLAELGVTLYSTGGTQKFIESLGISCVAVETLTSFPSILGGRVKTLHPSIFGGILGRRDNDTDINEMRKYAIPEIDLVIVDLYPFEETVANSDDDVAIIEKIDVGGPSMIRAAAKNHRHVAVVGSKAQYAYLQKLLNDNAGVTNIDERRFLAAKAFEVCAHYDVAIASYFNPSDAEYFLASSPIDQALRYGENPHQPAVFFGQLSNYFTRLNGKELSYNNLVDVDAAVQLIAEFDNASDASTDLAIFAIVKHTNVCGIAARKTLKDAWDAALSGDPESAFGGVLVSNTPIDRTTAESINEIFFEVLVAPSFDNDALTILKSKKNRIILDRKKHTSAGEQFKSLLGGVLKQKCDEGSFVDWKEASARPCTPSEKTDLEFANIICKHLKSNAIAIVKDMKLIGKGCGQTSRIDALRQAIEKAKHFNFDLNGAVLASDAFFPFNDCVQLAYNEGIKAFIQPGGSIRDKDSIDFCVEHDLAMVITGMRHFRH